MIETKYGKLEGIDHGWYQEYRGIPYAKPPVGELRWKAPQLPEPFEGVYQAVDFRNKSMQGEDSVPPWDRDFYDDAAYNRPASEDCLYLHIWAPKDAKNCPVAFWIHGGAFMGGWSSEKEFDGAAYCRRGVIFVSVGYRCSVFGFLAHPWLTEEAGTSGNYGMLDQIAALKWVYENIAAFGGDPEKITVFGQSAGAMSVQTLISSPLTGNMISRAILQSGGSYGSGPLKNLLLSGLPSNIPLAEQEDYGRIFSDVLGAGSLEEMRARSSEEVFEAMFPFFEKAMPLAKGLFLTPTIDGKVLTGSYYDLMDKGEIKDIPYMIGCTKDDILTPKDMDGPMDDPLYQGCVAFSHKLEELGRKPAYVYYFTRELPGDSHGAWHSAELWYMMGTMHRCWRPWTPEDYALSARMMDYWCNFMKNGDPNGNGMPEWEGCSKDGSFVMKLDVR